MISAYWEEIKTFVRQCRARELAIKFNAGTLAERIPAHERVFSLSTPRQGGGAQAAEGSLAILGPYKFKKDRDLADWMLPGQMFKGTGGAIGLVAGIEKSWCS
jgi:hypothetical protein